MFSLITPNVVDMFEPSSYFPFVISKITTKEDELYLDGTNIWLVLVNIDDLTKT